MARGFRGSSGAKEWSQIPGFANAFTANATAAGSSVGFNEAATVLRMIGEYVISIGSAGSVANDKAIVTVGIGVVSTDAAVLGSTAMPESGDEPEYPWLFWQSHALFFAGTSADPNSAAASVRHSFDVKSMRKMKPRESLVQVIQYEDVVGGPPVQFSIGNVRILILS